MAGTGHSYEIINVGEVRQKLASFTSRIKDSRSIGWFQSAHVLKFVTQPNFTIVVSAENASEAINANSDPEEREFLLGKVQAGGELRLFVGEFLDRAGPDFGHIADWIAALEKDDPRMLGKLGRIPVSAAVGHAGKWSRKRALDRVKEGEGKLASVLPTSGAVWVELLDHTALRAESDLMNHCVRDYGDALARGTRIFALRSADGASHVTIEIRAGNILGQVRGHSNSEPYKHRNAIIELLNRIGAERDHLKEAAKVGIVNFDGRWCSPIGNSDCYEINGLKGYVVGQSIHFISPVDPQSTIAVLTLPPGDGAKPDSWKQGRLFPAGESRKHLPSEQRAIARIANDLPGLHDSFPYLVRVDQRWVAWIDTCEKWCVDDVTFLMKDGIAYLMSCNERDVLIEVRADGRYTPFIKATCTAKDRTWTAADVRRTAAFMNILGVDHIEGLAPLDKAGLVGTFGKKRRWVRFQDHATVIPSKDPCKRWLVSPFLITLSGEFFEKVLGAVLRVECDDDGSVLYVRHLLAGRADLEELCSVLNNLGLVANVKFASSIGSYQWKDGSSRGGCVPIFVNGRWMVVTNYEAVLPELQKLKRRQFSDIYTNDLAIRLLPAPGTCEICDALLARHYAIWMRRVGEENITSPTPVVFSDTVDHIQNAAKLLHLMRPDDRRLVARIAERKARRIMGRKRRAKSFHDRNIVEQALARFGSVMSDRFIERAVPWVLRGYENLCETDGRIDKFWIDIYLRNLPKSRWAIKDAADNSTWHLICNSKKVRLNAPDQVADWLFCIEIAARTWHKDRKEHALEALAALVDCHAASPEWKSVIDELHGRRQAMKMAA